MLQLLQRAILKIGGGLIEDDENSIRFSYKLSYCQVKLQKDKCILIMNCGPLYSSDDEEILLTILATKVPENVYIKLEMVKISTILKNVDNLQNVLEDLSASKQVINQNLRDM